MSSRTLAQGFTLVLIVALLGVGAYYLVGFHSGKDATLAPAGTQMLTCDALDIHTDARAGEPIAVTWNTALARYASKDYDPEYASRPATSTLMLPASEDMFGYNALPYFYTATGYIHCPLSFNEQNLDFTQHILAFPAYAYLGVDSSAATPDGSLTVALNGEGVEDSQYFALLNITTSAGSTTLRFAPKAEVQSFGGFTIRVCDAGGNQKAHNYAAFEITRGTEVPQCFSRVG